MHSNERFLSSACETSCMLKDLHVVLLSIMIPKTRIKAIHTIYRKTKSMDTCRNFRRGGKPKKYKYILSQILNKYLR